MSDAVNYLAVVVAAVAAMAVGFGWYSNALFGKMWRHQIGLSEEQMKAGMHGGKMGKTILLGFISALVMAFVLAQFINMTGAHSGGAAFQLGFWAWLGFLATIEFSAVLWQKKHWKLFAIQAAHDLVAIEVMALVIALWK